MEDTVYCAFETCSPTVRHCTLVFTIHTHYRVNVVPVLGPYLSLVSALM